MFRNLMLIVLFAGILFAGCTETETEMQTGRAADYPTEIDAGDPAPTIYIQPSEGERTTLDAVSEPIYIVGFITMQPEADCSAANSQMKQLAEDLRLRGISVIQINTGCSDCEQFEEKRTGPSNFQVYCDGADQRAFNAFRRPPSGKLFLIDNDQFIESTANLDENLTVFKSEARELSRIEEDDREELRD